MAENLKLALQITLIGMGAVFAALLLLWLIMAALVRLTADPVDHVASLPNLETESQLDQRAEAAAVAVATALMQRRSVQRVVALPPTAVVSPWQAVMRGRQLKQRGPIR